MELLWAIGHRTEGNTGVVSLIPAQKHIGSGMVYEVENGLWNHTSFQLCGLGKSQGSETTAIAKPPQVNV